LFRKIRSSAIAFGNLSRELRGCEFTACGLAYPCLRGCKQRPGFVYRRQNIDSADSRGAGIFQRASRCSSQRLDES
jgi:hypothetical protein